jgi:hypothetical protein
MKKLIYTLLSIWFIAAIGCQKGPYPYISLDDAKKIDSLVHPAIKNVAFIYNGDIYFAADLNKPLTQITKDGNAKSFVKVAHDHSKFAYLAQNNQLTIVSDKGSLIASLSNYTRVKTFDWSADDKTLYILNGDNIAFYGPALKLPSISYQSFQNASDVQVVSASVSMRGDLAYIIHGFDFYVGDKYEMIIKEANNGKIIEYKPDLDGSVMDYVHFSANKQDLVLGYKATYGSNGEQTLELFTDLNAYPTGHYLSGGAATPVYNSTLNYLVAGKRNADNAISPAALYLGETPVYISANVAQTIVLDKYMLDNVLYIDWK